MSNQQTQDLIAEVVKTDGGIPLSVKKGGHGQGSYGIKELVYRYAMWISPAFELKVIRAYDALATGGWRLVGCAGLRAFSVRSPTRYEFRPEWRWLILHFSNAKDDLGRVSNAGKCLVDFRVSKAEVSGRGPISSRTLTAGQVAFEKLAGRV